MCEEEDTMKLSIFDEDIDDRGVNADEERIGRASSPFLPFALLPFNSASFLIFPLASLLITSASSNSSKGLTGNK